MIWSAEKLGRQTSMTFCSRLQFAAWREGETRLAEDTFALIQPSLHQTPGCSGETKSPSSFGVKLSVVRHRVFVSRRRRADSRITALATCRRFMLNESCNVLRAFALYCLAPLSSTAHTLCPPVLPLKVPGAAETSALACIARFVCRIYYLVYTCTTPSYRAPYRFVSRPSAYEFGGGRRGCKPASSFRTSLA